MSDELLTGPLELYWAPVGTAFPAPDAAIDPSWVLIGKSGTLNYSEDGVSVVDEGSVVEYYSAGSRYPVARAKPQGNLRIKVRLNDFSMDALRLAFNLNQITTVAPQTGAAGYKELDLTTSVELQEFALLIRGVGKSAELAGENLQFELPRVQEVAESHEWIFKKGPEPAGVELEFAALVDPATGNVATLKQVNAAAL